MRILMTTDPIGGVWTYAAELAAELAGRGDDVLLASIGSEVSASQREQIARLPNVRLVHTTMKLEWMPYPWEDVHRTRKWLRQIANSYRPEIVHLNQYCYGDVDFGDAPVLVVAHSCVLSWWSAVKREPAPPEYGHYAAMVRRGLRGADAIVAPSRSMRDALLDHYGPLADVDVIYNGRAPSTFYDMPKAPVIFAAGRMWDDAKNLDTLCRAAPQIVWPVEVAGSTRHPNGYDVACDAVRQLGQFDEEQMIARLASASIFVSPARYEPYGLAVLEAALSGCALVLSDIPTFRELWQGAAAFVPADDAEALARATNDLIRNVPLRRRLVAASAARARQWTVERQADQYQRLYASLAGEPVPSPVDLERH